MSPLEIDFDTARPEKQVVVIGDQNTSEFFVSDGSSTVYTTDIQMGLPVQVRVAGRLLEKTEYTVDAINPVAVTLVAAPASSWLVDVFIVQARVFYAQGVDTASDGQPLQEQETLAAWFIEGRV